MVQGATCSLLTEDKVIPDVRLAFGILLREYEEKITEDGAAVVIDREYNCGTAEGLEEAWHTIESVSGGLCIANTEEACQD